MDGTTGSSGGSESESSGSSGSSGSSESSGTGTGTGTSTDGGSTDTGSETGETETGGEVEPGACATECVAGCSSVLFAALQGEARLWHTASARLALDEVGRAILFEAPSDVIVDIFGDVDEADLAGGTVGLQSGNGVELRDASNAGLLGAVDVTGADWGLARDGTFVWVADPVALSVYELDGSLRWTLGGDFTDATVLALPDAVHVHAPADPSNVQHVDAVAGTATTVGFAGTFDGWFYDAPRFWTLQADAFRVYESDGTQIALAEGDPGHGYADFVVHDYGDVVTVGAPDTVLLSIDTPQFSGPAVLGGDFSDVLLVRLDQGMLSSTPITPACCATSFDTDVGFAWAADQWMISGPNGQLYDHQGDSLSNGEVVTAYGSTSGRLGIGTTLNQTWIWDVAPDCTVTYQDRFSRVSEMAEMAADGSVLVGNERINVGGGFVQLQMRVYDLPNGALLDSLLIGSSSFYARDVHVSDDASLVSAAATFNSSDNYVWGYPGFTELLGNGGVLAPAVSPDGTLWVRSDGDSNFGGTFEGSSSYVYDAMGLLAVFDGVTLGFVDDDTLLVASYMETESCFLGAGECDLYLGADLTDVDGNVIAAAPIPEPRGFTPLSSNVVFIPEPPAIYDLTTGEALWSGEGPAAPVGSDHVAHVVDGDLVLTRWQ